MFSEHAMQAYINKMEEDGLQMNANKFSAEATGADQLEKSRHLSAASHASNSEVGDVVLDKSRMN